MPAKRHHTLSNPPVYCVWFLLWEHAYWHYLSLISCSLMWESVRYSSYNPFFYLPYKIKTLQALVKFTSQGSILNANMWVTGSHKCYCSFPSSEPPCSTAEEVLCSTDRSGKSANQKVTRVLLYLGSQCGYSCCVYRWMFPVDVALNKSSWSHPSIPCTYLIMNNNWYNFFAFQVLLSQHIWERLNFKGKEMPWL